MQIRNMMDVLDRVNAFLDKLDELDDSLTSKEKFLAKKIRLSLKDTSACLRYYRCLFNKMLGDVLDCVVDFCNKEKICENVQTKNFKELVNDYHKSTINSDANDESFMLARKFSTHLKEFKKSMDSFVEKKQENNLKIVTILKDYLSIVIDLLKFEKYNRTTKLTVSDKNIHFSRPDVKLDKKIIKPEAIINCITSKDFVPKESDIMQGHISDCYLLAALKNIVRSNPDAIKKCFVSNEKDGIIMRFYKVDVTTKVADTKDKVMLTSKSSGRVMIKMNKSLLADCSTGSLQLLGNQKNFLSSIWVGLIEKAYAIYLANNNVTDNALSFKNLYRRPFIRILTSNNDLSVIEYGLSNIPTTAITGKQGISFLPYTSFKPLALNDGNVGGNVTENSPSQSTADQFIEHHNPIDPSTIVEIIRNCIKEGKAVTAGTKPRGHFCWKKQFQYNGNNNSQKEYLSLFGAFFPSHAYSVTGIDKIDGKDYIVLSNPHMNRTGFIITGNQITDYGDEGNVRLTAEDFGKYFSGYSINKLKRKKR